MNGALAGHIVLVTGAAGTLGRAMCEAIEQAGGIAIRSDLAGRGVPDIALDVTREADWQAAVAEIERTHGRLDGLVNNAGVATPGDVEETTFAEWRRVMAINADGVFLGCKYAMPLLAKSKAASIVNISSASGIVGGANLAAYNASKGAVRLLTKSVALSGARKRPPVRCNSVHPAFIEGDMVDAIVHGRPDPEKAMAKLQAQIPIGRLGRPQEVATTRGLAAVAGLLVHDRLRGAGGRRPDRRLKIRRLPPNCPKRGARWHRFLCSSLRSARLCGRCWAVPIWRV